MNAIIFIFAILAAIWAPYCTGLIIARVRYWHRQRTGYITTNGVIKS